MSGPNTSYDPVEVAALDPHAIEEAVTEALAAAAAATSLDELKAARTAHQGDKSPLALANREIGALPPSAKAEAGKRVGQARGRVAQAFTARQGELEIERDERILTDEAVDVTLPSGRRPLGRRHPIELMSQRIADLFVGMGWEIAEGPEIEAEWFNFDALNFDADHPARQMQDTFYVDPPEGGLVLRTHTSPVQARTLLERGVPVYVAAIGRVFRTDELDATHMPAFHQVEGLAVDEGITWPTSRAPSTASPPSCSVRASRHDCARATSPSPSPAPRWTCAASSAVARTRPAARARAPAGSSGVAAGWSTATC